MGQNLGYIKHPNLPGAYWICNLPAIYANLDNIFGFKVLAEYKGNDVMVINGGNSFYKLDREVFLPVFPNLDSKNFIKIQGASHWVQVDKPKELIEAISDFLLDLDSRMNYTPTGSLLF